MQILSTLHGSFLGYAAIFTCIGFSLLFLREATREEAGPGYWGISFFLNGMGFLAWAGGTTSSPFLFFAIGEAFHMLGFMALVSGIYQFTGNSFRRWNAYALGGLLSAWVGVFVLMALRWPWAVFPYSALRAVLFLYGGSMILKCIPLKALKGRNLAGRGLMFWGLYVLLFPLMNLWPPGLPFVFGFLVGFHVLAVVGMMIMIVDRMRVRVETIEHHAQRLEGLLPICSRCKKIRDDQNHWHSIESYIGDRSDAEFSHGICPECAAVLYPEFHLYE
jgi:hypothetical protein